MAKAMIALVAAHATAAKSTVRVPALMSQTEVEATDITLSGSSQLADISVPVGKAASLFWAVTAYGAALRVKFGKPTPEASSGSGWFVGNGETRTFGASEEGEKAAVVLA